MLGSGWPGLKLHVRPAHTLKQLDYAVDTHSLAYTLGKYINVVIELYSQNCGIRKTNSY